MSGKGNYWSNGILNALFNAATLANVIENASASPITTIYISLHTADPGASGNQGTNECSYTSYTRIGVSRNTSGWPTTTTESISPAANIVFPTSTGGGTQTASFMGIGTASSGAGNLLYSGPITPNITINTGTQPQLTTATAISEA